MVGVEQHRLYQADAEGVPWRRWGPYLSERQWGTVREDYSAGGDAWSSFTHDQARSRAYRWGEDGLAGFSDDQPAPLPGPGAVERAGPDPQGASVRPDQQSRATTARTSRSATSTSTPRRRSSYLKMLYKYPQGEFPYADLVATEPARGASSTPSTSCSTPGSSTTTGTSTSRWSTPRPRPEDILMQVTVHNRGPEDAALHVLPTLWFRHTWSWAGGSERAFTAGRSPAFSDSARSWPSIPSWARRWFYGDGAVPVLVTGNETNNERVFGTPNRRALCEGRHRPGRRARRAHRGGPERDRHQGGAALQGGGPGRRQRDDAPASDRPRAG